MIERIFQGERLGLLGFGTMRLPLQADGTVDENQVRAMTAYAMAHATATGITAALRVLGRMASNHAFGEFLFTLFSFISRYGLLEIYYGYSASAKLNMFVVERNVSRHSAQILPYYFAQCARTRAV